MQSESLPPGCLRLADLGYFSIPVLKRYSQQKVYWITRIQPRTAVFDAQGERLPLCRWLKQSGKPVQELSVLLGLDERLASRLIAVRVPPRVRRKRLARLLKDAKRRARPVSQAQRDWTQWTIYATNLPSSLATWQEICVLYRVRWQIELLFKLWKSQNRMAQSSSKNPVRILAEIFAKMLGVVVQHWMLLTTVWRYCDRSLPKAVPMLAGFVQNIALALHRRQELEAVLEQMQRCFQHRCKMNTRKKRPNTYQLLLDATLLNYG